MIIIGLLLIIKSLFILKKTMERQFFLYVGLENLLGIEMFSKAIKKNATIGSIFQTDKFQIPMIAVGSLNISRMYTDYQEQKNYQKGTPCGYFSIGSSMLLCFPDFFKILMEIGENIKTGKRILL